MDNTGIFGASAAGAVASSGGEHQRRAEIKPPLSAQPVKFGGLKDGSSMNASDVPTIELIRSEAIANDAVFIACRSHLDVSVGAVVLMRSRSLVAQFPSEVLAEEAAWTRFPDGVFSIHVIDEALPRASVSAFR